jgi:serine/threonine protein kinase
LPDAVAQVAAGLLVAPERAGPAGLPVVAGYEILGPLGRGGTGLVYQARQLKAGQVVALKMIRGGAHAEPRDLARFRTEAEAVARLQHPNIVPVYEVGEQDGWAYLALEFVPGGSLARHLAGRPQPPGPSARLLETLARAVAYAHERGVIHRDLKPANVLLQQEATTDYTDHTDQDKAVPASPSYPCDPCNPWFSSSPKITDFGLAKRLDPEEAPAPRDRTQTGEILGTPSYMAPEQTWGRPAEVGPAADVYALGAILYECLTGRPPFQAATPLDTLLQVRGEELVPPRRLVPSLPRDLDTVCRKCLHKEPRRRYPSAAALADDLHRFQAGQRVQARPPGIWERGARWARRRPAVAALLGVSAAALLSLAALGAWHHAELRRYAAEVSAQRQTADEMRGLAEAKLAEVGRQKAEAEKQWRRAEANHRRALAGVERVLTWVGDEGPADDPRLERVRRKLLEDALEFYQDILKEFGADAGLRWERAMTHYRIATVQKQLGRHADAARSYDAAIPAFQALAAEFPRRPDYRLSLAGCYTNLGNLVHHTARHAEALPAARRGAEVLQALAETTPGAKYRWALAGSLHNLGVFLADERRAGEAEQAFRRALALRERLAEAHPGDAASRLDVARTHHNLGRVLDLAGRQREAEQAFRRALTLYRGLAKEFPRAPAYRQELAGSLTRLAAALDRLDRRAEADAEFAEGLALQERLAGDFPRTHAYRRDLAESHHLRARSLERRQRPAEAEQAYRRSLEFRRRLVHDFPRIPRQQAELAEVQAQLARLLLRRGRPAEARREAELAVRHQRAALQLLPGFAGYRRDLALHYRVLVEALLRLGDYAAVVETAAEAAGDFPRRP